MKRASYREAIAWIAMNDSAGDDDALDPKAAGSLITSCLVADIFGIDQDKVGADVVKYRRKESQASENAKAIERRAESPVRFEGTREDSDETFRDDGL